MIQNFVSTPVVDAQETASADKSEFKLTMRNVFLGFGSPSSPDGNGTLAETPGYETACINLTLVARRLQ